MWKRGSQFLFPRGSTFKSHRRGVETGNMRHPIPRDGLPVQITPSRCGNLISARMKARPGSNHTVAVWKRAVPLFLFRRRRSNHTVAVWKRHEHFHSPLCYVQITPSRCGNRPVAFGPSSEPVQITPSRCGNQLGGSGGNRTRMSSNHTVAVWKRALCALVELLNRCSNHTVAVWKR